MSFVTFENVSKFYQMGEHKIAAANQVSFEIEKGEFAVIVGPSGAGKTTVLNMLAEATTTEIPKQKAPSTFSENIAVAREGGEAAGIARKAVEERTDVPVITSKNAAQLNQVVTDLLEGAAADMSEMPEKK